MLSWRRSAGEWRDGRIGEFINALSNQFWVLNTILLDSPSPDAGWQPESNMGKRSAIGQVAMHRGDLGWGGCGKLASGDWGLVSGRECGHLSGRAVRERGYDMATFVHFSFLA